MNCPKYVEFYSKNKFEKFVHLVGFIIRTKTKVLLKKLMFFFIHYMTDCDWLCI